jgi:hypothetical protein
MNTFNRKIAARIFYTLVILDAVLLVLQHLISGTWQILPWWIINAPGFLLTIVIGPLFPPSAVATTCMMIIVGLFSAVVWAAIFGFLCRRKAVA